MGRLGRKIFLLYVISLFANAKKGPKKVVLGERERFSFESLSQTVLAQPGSKLATVVLPNSVGDIPILGPWDFLGPFPVGKTEVDHSRCLENPK